MKYVDWVSGTDNIYFIFENVIRLNQDYKMI